MNQMEFERFVPETGKHGTHGSAASGTETAQSITSTNLFAITAYAAELPEGTESGDVLGIRQTALFLRLK